MNEGVWLQQEATSGDKIYWHKKHGAGGTRNTTEEQQWYLKAIIWKNCTHDGISFDNLF